MFTAALFKIAKDEKAQRPNNKWMDKQIVVYTHNEILFDHKKQLSTHTCYNMDDQVKDAWYKKATLYDFTYVNKEIHSNRT